MNMKEVYAEECGQDYSVMWYQEQMRQTITKELLERVLRVQIIKFEIDFERETIDYCYKDINYNKELYDYILISNFIRECYELDDYND